MRFLLPIFILLLGLAVGAFAGEGEEDPCAHLPELKAEGGERLAAEIERVEALCRSLPGRSPEAQARIVEEIEARITLIRTRLEGEALEEALEKWQREREALAREVTRLEEELAALTKAEREGEAELQQLRQAISAAQARIDALRRTDREPPASPSPADPPPPGGG